MSHLQFRLLNNYQRDFPLVSTPFNQIAKQLDVTQATILQILNDLISQGYISRVGPVFPPNTIGISTLAAMTVPPEHIIDVAHRINKFKEVNHNYEREHIFNLWFVVNAPHQKQLNKVLREIQQNTDYEMLILPLLKEYHIDLGFDLTAATKKQTTTINKQSIKLNDTYQNAASQALLIKTIQAGIPLLEKPFLHIAEGINLTETEVIQSIQAMQIQGKIRRFGVVVRHHELGYLHNAMLVINCPDKQIDEVGVQLAAESHITLCYQRPRVLPYWQYNLFSMIHGKNRKTVLSHIENILTRCNLHQLPHTILFSKHRFKQRGALHYCG